LIKKEPGKFDLLITDMEMPRLDGYRLVVKARAAGSREESCVCGSVVARGAPAFRRSRCRSNCRQAAEHRQLISVVARLQTELWERANSDAA
jgi:CheY-like chemotaxis protein